MDFELSDTSEEAQGCVAPPGTPTNATYDKYLKYKNKYFELQNQVNALKSEPISYYTHDNGGKPFKVDVDGKNVKIYMFVENSEDKSEESIDGDYSMCILTFESDIVFIGESPNIEMSRYSHGPKYDGNSILLHIKNNEYVFIGTKIFSFEALSTIVNFVSPVGNNDVPYPYAIDENGNIYLLIEDVVIKSNDTLVKHMEEFDTPYGYYYKYSKIVTWNDYKPKCMPIFQNIKEFYIGGDRYDLTFHTFPEENYKRLTNIIGSPLSIVDYDGKKHILTKEDYVKIMKSFADANHFEPLCVLQLYQKRLL